MALVTKNFTLNVTPGAMPPTVHVSEYDIGRTYAVQLLDENGSAYEIPTGTTATVEGTLNGTVGFTTSATIDGNQISFALTESMTAYAGKAWCKIKLTQNSQPIQTCAFVLAVDRAGVEAGTVIGADGFEQQIVDAVQDWLDEHPPASGGMTEAFKQALLDCFENVAWINDDGQTYYDALYAALYPPTEVLSISAVFTQGSAVIHDTDSLDTLKQYLTVTATMTDSTTRTLEDTDYTLSGTLTVGTSTITVSYGGKTTTFNVTVTEKTYQLVEYVETDGASRIDTGVVFDGTKEIEVTLIMSFNGTMPSPSSVLNGWSAGGAVGVVDNARIQLSWTDGAGDPHVSTHLGGTDLLTECKMTIQAGNSTNTISVFTNTTGTKTLTRTHTNVANRTFLPFPLFALSLQSAFDYALAGLRIQSAVIKLDGTVVRNMSACYRTADDVIGFYDSVNDVFYTNAGTGTFTKGGDIS